jgi:hypothetical protein
LLQTLSAVQSQLRDLEDENSISRRRVRELEMELEECKRHVARERTRLIEREELETWDMVKQPKQFRIKGRAGQWSLPLILMMRVCMRGTKKLSMRKKVCVLVICS